MLEDEGGAEGWRRIEGGRGSETNGVTELGRYEFMLEALPFPLRWTDIKSNDFICKLRLFNRVCGFSCCILGPRARVPMR